MIRVNLTFTHLNMTIDKDEISLIDLLILVAENLKLLVMGPLLVGALALALTYTMPKSYSSQAIIALPASNLQQLATLSQQTSAVMVSPLVLDAVVKSLELAGDRSVQTVREGLIGSIKIDAGKEGLLQLDVIADTPLKAQSIANAIIDNWLKTTLPSEQERAELSMRHEYAEFTLASIRRLMDRVAKDGKSHTSSDGSVLSIASLAELRDKYLAEVLKLSRSLNGLTRDVVKQPPTLPTEPIAPRKTRITIAATLGAAIVLFLWIFMRRMWRDASQNPETSRKLLQLKKALGKSCSRA